MKKLYVVIMSLFVALSMNAQKKEWNSPVVGFSNTDYLAMEKVTFSSKNTVVKAVVRGDGGDMVNLSSEAYLSSEGKMYPIVKMKNAPLDKPFMIPDSGKIHIEMFFPPMPDDVKVMQFSEMPGDDGWKLCNIRATQTDIVTNVPADWADVTYSSQETLPVTEFCDDSTVVEVKILNYTPDMGRTFGVTYRRFDADRCNTTQRFEIAEDGTAVARIHPCFPLTVYACVGNTPAMPFVVVPGGKLSVLIDAANAVEGFRPKAFKGSLASVNYEINTLGCERMANYDNTPHHMDSLILSGKNMLQLVDKEYHEKVKAISNGDCSLATKEWLRMKNDVEYIRHRSLINRYVSRLVNEDLKKADSKILKNPMLAHMIVDKGVCDEASNIQQNICASDKLTLFPKFLSYMNVFAKGVDVSDIAWDLWRLHWAEVNYEMYSEEEAENNAAQIKNEDVKKQFQKFKHEWDAYVGAIRKLPHVHFDEYGVSAFDVKEKFLNSHKGKYIFFVAYNGDASDYSKTLDAFDAIADDLGKDRSLLAYVDVSLPYSGVSKWMKSASGRKGEMYGGLKTRYGMMFNQKYSYGDAGCYFEVCDPEGNNVFSTCDESEMIEAIKAFMKGHPVW